MNVIKFIIGAIYRAVDFIIALGVKKVLLILLIAAAISGVCGSYYFYTKYSALKTNPNIEAQKQTESVVATVGKLMELPKGEVPTVATISDKDKLKDQGFFRTAENGDILLAYTTAMQAILYRPSTNKIINVAPISINQAQSQAQGIKSGTPASTALRIAYYNGTDTVGLATLSEKAIQKKYPAYQTASLTNAAKKEYKGNLVVDISGTHAKEAADIALTLGGRVGSLPQGETAPDADILVISGQ